MESNTDETTRREVIEKFGKIYFDTCKKIARMVTRLKKKGDR